MFRPLALFIGLRYTRAKKRNHFISFIAFSSMIGIALGVAVLITVLSVMNGFDEEISAQVFGVVPHITVTQENSKLTDWPQWKRHFSGEPHILGAAPFVNGQGLLTQEGQVYPALITGILPEEERHISELEEKMTTGTLSRLKPGQFGIVMGEDLAMGLGLGLGDKVVLMVPSMNVSIAGMTPRFKRFTLIGTFRIGGGFRFDNNLAYIHLKDAQALFGLGTDVSGLRLKVDSPFAAPHIARQLAEKLPSQFLISNWTGQYGAFFKAIKLEKNMMFFILLLIIAVAAFNLVSSLVMVVTDKQSDIAILRTLGVTPKTIVATFMVQGCVIGFLGTFLGLLGGILLALNVTEVVNVIQHLLNLHFISADIYFIDYLPSRLDWGDVTKIGLIALAMSFIATIYPAWRAAKVQPAEALRYE